MGGDALTVFVAEKVKVKDVVFEAQIWTHWHEPVSVSYNTNTVTFSNALEWVPALARAPSVDITNSSTYTQFVSI